MASAVKPRRGYRSAVRDEQARRTRERIVRAARLLFLKRGYNAASIAAIADAAGVAPETVYAIFRNKRAVLEGVVTNGISGAEETAGWLERAWVRDLLALPDVARRIRGFARHTAKTVARMSPLHAVIRSAAGSEPELAELYRRIQADRFAAQGRILAALAPGPAAKRAAETFSAVSSPELHHLLTGVRGWSEARYEAWLEELALAVVAGRPGT